MAPPAPVGQRLDRPLHRRGRGPGAAPALRWRALADITAGDGGKTIHSWSRALVVIVPASVDSGVFDVPEAAGAKKEPAR
jgi:hypothetical protein